MHPFFRIELRTTDVAAARAFYAAVLGDRSLGVVSIPEESRARGARSLWLGHVGVDDLSRAVGAFTARGAVALGPRWTTTDGLDVAMVRDPGGAVVALAESASASVTACDAVWFQLHTTDAPRARANYQALFGWAFEEPVGLGALGVFHPFRWEPEGPVVGVLSDVAQRPGVHPHWLFHLPVASFDRALEVIAAEGGVLAGTFALPSGERVAICDDPQGAAFAIREEAVR